MSTDLYVQTLHRFETADDGSSITIVVEDFSGRSARVLFPLDCLTSLIMTLPEMVTTAMQQARRDPTLRVVFPMGKFEVEVGSEPDTRILTLGTSDGFTVSFSMSEQQYHEFSGAEVVGARPPSSRVKLN